MYLRSLFTAPIVVAALVLLAAAPVAAASPWSTYGQSGTSAFVASVECVEGPGDGLTTCNGRFLDVFKGTIRLPGESKVKADQICYFTFTETLDSESGEPIESRHLSGCALDAGTVAVSGLTTVSLAPTVVQLSRSDCDAFECSEPVPAGATSVSGTWTGVGPIYAEKNRSTTSDGTCVDVSLNKGERREASFSGSFVGDASIAQGSFTYRFKCSGKGG
jgi:hypothetical protein